MDKAIIMGASSGIGREVARLLLAKGWQVGVAARRLDRLEALRQEYGERVVAAPIDITRPEASGQLLALVERLGGLDLYVHVAGIGWQNRMLEEEKERLTVATNASAFVNMVGTVFRYMAGQGGGHIAAVTSIAGTRGLGPAPAYSATKAMQTTYLEALEQLSRQRRLGIRLTDIRPGFVDTDLLAGTRYPMLMKKERVARKAVAAILRGQSVCTIDGRYRLLVACWRWVPRWLWRQFRL